METYDSYTNGNSTIGGGFESNRAIVVPAITASSKIELARGRKIRFGVTRDKGEAPYYSPFAKEFRCSLEFFLTRGEIASESSPVPLPSSSRFAVKTAAASCICTRKGKKTNYFEWKVGPANLKPLDDRWRIAKSPIKPDPKKEKRTKG